MSLTRTMTRRHRETPGRWGDRTGAHGNEKEYGGTLPLLYHISLPLSTWQFSTFLGYGEANAISAAALSRMSGLSAREIRAETEAARRAGVPICTSSEGYFIAETDAEKADCIQRLRRQAEALERTASALERALIIKDAS